VNYEKNNEQINNYYLYYNKFGDGFNIAEYFVLKLDGIILIDRVITDSSSTRTGMNAK